MGLAAVGNQKVIGPITAGHIFWTSLAIGRRVRGAEEGGRRRFTNLRLGQPQKNERRPLPEILGADLHGS